MTTVMGSAARLTAWISWASYLGLVVVQVLDSAAQQAPWPVWLFKLLPLLIFLPGILRENLRSYIWLCFVCLIYFLALTLRLFAVPGDVLGAVGMLCVIALFCSAMVFVRLRARETRPADDAG